MMAGLQGVDADAHKLYALIWNQFKEALAWQILMREELGRDWLNPDLFRFGASSMLGDIERQLEHYVTGRYADSSRHALA